MENPPREEPDKNFWYILEIFWCLMKKIQIVDWAVALKLNSTFITLEPEHDDSFHTRKNLLLSWLQFAHRWKGDLKTAFNLHEFPAKCLTASDPLTFFFRIFHGEGTKITHQPPSPKCGFDVIIPKDDHQILPEQWTKLLWHSNPRWAVIQCP